MTPFRFLIELLVLIFFLTLFCYQNSLASQERAPLVAVIDTGVDLENIDLQSTLWVNAGEQGLDQHGRNKGTNGVDDDQNGVIDDVHGANFASPQTSLKDQHGHGTHIAGLIHQEAPEARLMIIKYWDPLDQRVNPLAALTRALLYAKKMGAQIVNYSGGGFTPDPAEAAAVFELTKSNILLVSAAGNESENCDKKQFYPASYGFSNVLAVSAHDSLLNLLPSSNYGSKVVQIAALGFAVQSWVPGNKKGPMTGTSQATALVSGAAAHLMALRATRLTPQDIIAQISGTAKFSSSLAGRVKSSGALNIERMLKMIGPSQSYRGQKLLRPPETRRSPVASLH